ncbi:MAG: beta-ketoacyl-[acyl-carrier-protein] synthase II [Candidatus Schekmanbacteria bacterium GWA2_38_11]|uniref:3-oxoacyl-[acyl-carrier-protein] synthase 2 n=1 Tax=Candidatus Schekmanbacteria bacterium GWA2_38_11 TaxID=1817876 RepID=A0A1F7RPI1_9BACT|nr:MAG: beta-ketoacyl-[acyl-carrier-protein] synthase II [Candidatus Schekmanbacteria bacterium GWA2_38_11]
MSRRVVITGIGIIASNGIGKEKFWDSLKNGRSGIKTISSFDASTYPCHIAGEVTDFDPMDYIPPQTAKRIDRFAQFGLAATKMAIDDSRLDLENEDRSRVGVILGTSVGALAIGERQHSIFLEKGYKRINPFFATSIIPSSCATQIMIEYKINGLTQTITTACASSTSAVGEAFEYIKNGKADIVITGGSETPITPFAIATFANVNLLSKRNGDPSTAYRPFSRDRDGIVFGEGAGIIILEELEHAKKRKAKIYSKILGYGATSDAYHVMAPLPDASQASKAIRIALEEAGITPEEVDYINVHGSGTIINDKAETLIIKDVFGKHSYKLAVSATKSMTGHAMGGCGALEIVASILMLENQFLHPTINLEVPDPECDLDYIPNRGYKRNVNIILKTSFGFGGYNSAVILRKFEG